MISAYSILLLVGLVSGFLLFKKLPTIKTEDYSNIEIKISVIIPARNEEKNLPGLLGDLQKQSYKIDEIICVDDNSVDNTKGIIKEFGVTYIQAKEKPSDWMGKTWACQLGAQHARGEVFIFIDADVRLEKEAIEKLIRIYQEENSVISVQPYHKVTEVFEQCSFFFNMIGLGANGVGFPYSKKKAGLFGPFILINQKSFLEIEGFGKVRSSIIEDVALGQVMQQHGIDFKLFIGYKELSFTMYSDFKSLFLGFAKNFASGAMKTPGILLVLTFLWILTITAVPFTLLEAIVSGNQIQLIEGILLYLIIVVHLIFVARKMGSFKIRYIIFYPILLMIFHVVFFYSIYAKMIRKKVSWKGRDISL